MYTFNKFDLKDLTLWELNPRLDEDDNDDIVVSILNNQGEKLYRLAKDIAKQGLTEPIAILKDNNINLVKEGNRRIASLKILENPNIINNYVEKSDNENLKNKFLKLSKSIKANDLFKNIIARVYEREYEDELDLYIAHRHLGENNGVGIVKWNANQKSRWSILQGNSQPVTQFLNFLKENKVLTIYEINGVTKTNWDRIFNSKIFQDYLGLKKINKTISSVPLNNNIILKYKIIANNLKKKTVRIVYDDDARKEFLTKIDFLYNEKLNKKQNSQDNFLVDHTPSPLIIIPSETQNYDTVNKVPNDSDKTNRIKDSLSINLIKDDNLDNDNYTSNGINKNPNPKRSFFTNLTMYGVKDIADNKGIIFVVKEIQKISRSALYKDYPIASTFLMRSLIEQSLIYKLKKYNSDLPILKEGNGSPKLDKIINYYSNNLSNVFSKDNLQISRSFKAIFNNAGTKDYMDMVIHNPHLVTGNSDILDIIVESGLFTVINFILNEK